MVESKLSLYSINSPDFVSQYDLKSKIGEGAFSDVWLCVERNSGQNLAAKILKKKYGTIVEADTCKAVSEVSVSKLFGKHPFLLIIEKAYHETNTGKVILITELMNRSSYDVINNGECPLSECRIKTYMYQILEGLRYLHEKGFIHRDIKPENILLKSHDKWLKIGDFGTVCRKRDGQPYAEYVATRWYRSPECLLTRGWYSSKLDIWSAGCVLYEMATGRPLFDGQDDMDQVDKIDRLLGSPDYRLIEKFKRHKSDTFTRRYDTGKRGIKRVPAAGLHTAYQPHRPAFEIFKDMIVYDPVKRFSADRLLRKQYFYEMRYTAYEDKIRRFETSLHFNKAAADDPAKDEVELYPVENGQLLKNNKQGPGGDRISNLLEYSVEDDKFDFYSNTNKEYNRTCLGKRDSSNVCLENDIEEASIVCQEKRNSSNVSLEDAVEKCATIQKPVNVNLANRNQNLRYVYSKVNTNNAPSPRKPLINVVSSFKRALVKAQNSSFINRPPFKF